ncbi:tyrosine-type recombinase/integrase [Pedobacter jejuensis]|nr:tyrosine-type recombinase/integrase [Pedobacter jejuensis]
MKPSEMAVFCVNENSVHKTGKRRTKFRNMICPYKLPEVKRYSNNDWCVEYWYAYPPDWKEYPGLKRFKVREGINYIKDPIKKETEIVNLCRTIEIALTKLNYNPFDEIENVKSEKAKKKLQEELDVLNSKDTIPDSFDWFLDKKRKENKGDRTIDGYKSFLKNFILWIDKRNSNPENKQMIYINDVLTETIESYLEETSEENEWQPRTYNNNLKGLITAFNYLHKKKKIDINPLADGVIETRTSRAEQNKYYSKEVREIIQPKLNTVPYLSLFIKWIYYTCARTNEIPRLRVSDIDLNLRKIRVSSEVGKTGEHVGDRTIPICEELYDIILKMNIKKYPSNYFVFSRALKPGDKILPDDFFRDLYRPIKRALNLDRNYTIYSFKHTRVVDLLAAGFPSQKVMFLTGHTDWASFQKYCRELGAVIDEQLKGKTISY